MSALWAALVRMVAEAVARIVSDWRRDRALRDQAVREARDDADEAARGRRAQADQAAASVAAGGDHAGRVRDRFARD